MKLFRHHWPAADGDPTSLPYYRLVLRGWSQVCFQSNELTGLCFLAAALVASPIAAAYLLVAGTIAPAGRMALGGRHPEISTGLPGLNPSLIGLALPTFFETGWTNTGMWTVLVLCVAATVLLARLAAALPFPVLALPFLIVLWVVWALAPSISVLQRKPFAELTSAAYHPVEAVLSGLGEAVFSATIWSGLLFLAGLLVSNWRHAVIAVIGAVISTVVSYRVALMSSSSLNAGLFGFNGVLTAVAVYALCGSRLRLAVLGALIAAVLTPAFTRLGVPAASAPFVLSTWLVLALGWFDRRWFAPARPVTGHNAPD
ncbi:MAG: urea transporter [Actinomycetota bacterium]|nr:urea transporter [Actinomycetota bacterium]